MLIDSVTKTPREVDVVMECPEGDLTQIISFEVLAKKRPADVIWVQGQQKKHETLPTNTLVLVSWSGFTQTARRQAESDPKLKLVTPAIVRDSAGASVTLTVDVTRRLFTATKIVLAVEAPGYGVVRVKTEDLGLGLHDSKGARVGTVGESAQFYMTRPGFFDRVAAEQRERPGPKWFRLRKDMRDSEAFLFEETKQELHRVVELEMWGVVSWEQSKVDLNITTLNDILFGHGRSHFDGVDLLFVANLAPDSITKLAVRGYPQAPAHKQKPKRKPRI
jgi:hypothetical protein